MSVKTNEQLIKENAALNKKILRFQKNLENTQRKLYESEQDYESLQSILESTLDIVFLVTKKGLIKYLSPSVYQVLGYDKNKIIGTSYTKYVPAKEKLRYIQDIKDVFKNKKITHFETQIKNSKGELVQIEINGKLVKHGNETLAHGTIRDISGRVSAENSRKESEEFYRTLFEFSPSGIIIEDKHGKILDVNPAWCKSLGYKRKDILGQKIHKLAHVDNSDNVDINIKNLLLGKKLKQTVKSVRKDGTICYIQLNERAITLPAGEQGILSISLDMTKETQALEALKESEESYKGLFDNSIDAIYIQDREGRFVNVNQAVVDMYGYPREFFIGKTPEPISAPGKNDLEKVVNYLEKAFKGKPQQFEFWGRRKNGEIFPKIVRLNKGTYFGKDIVFAFALDITDQKNSELALLESEEKYRLLAETARDFIITHDLKGNILYANKSAMEISGYGYELQKMNVKDIVSESELANIQGRGSKRRARGRDSFLYEIEIVANKNQRIPVEVSSSLFKLQNKPHVMLIVARDITERKKSEAALAEKTILLDNILRSSSDHAIATTDMDFRITYFNSMAAKFFGYTTAKSIGKTIHEIHNFENVFPGKFENTIEKIRLEGEYRYSLEQNTDTGIRYLESRISGIYDPEGRGVGYSLFSRDVTERVFVEKALLQSEEKYRQLVDNSLTGIYIIQNHILKFCNQCYANIFGYDKCDELIGIDLRKIVAPESWNKVNREVKLRESGKKLISQYELKGVKKDGSVFDVEVLGARIEYAGKPAIQGTLIDITKRKIAERELTESEEKFRILAEQSPNMIFINVKGKVVYANRACEEIIGYSREEFYSPDFDFISLISKDSIPIIQKNLRKHSQGIDVEPYEYSLITKKGEIINAIIATKLINYEKHSAILGIVTDITARKKVEEALCESEQRYRQLFELLPYGGEVLDTKGYIINHSPSTERLLGYDSGEMKGKHITEFLTKKSIQTFKELFPKLLSGNSAQSEINMVKKNGTELTILRAAQPILNNENKVDSILALSVDITERKQAEKEISRLATLVEQSVESLAITDTDGTLQYVNPAFEKVTGYKRKELIGNNPRILKSGQHSKQFYEDMWTTITAGRKWEGIIINKRKNGNLYYEKAIIFPIKDKSGNIINYASIMRDITLERKLENQLQQIQKMEAIGTLSGGVAHDFNNLLTVINGHAELAIMKVSSTQKVYNDLLSILNAGKRAERLTSQLLAFSRKQIHQLKVVDINHLLSDLEKMLRRLIPEDIITQTDLSSELPYIKADPGQIEQIIINLVINARDAINENKKAKSKKIIYISTQFIDLDDLFVSRHPGSQTGPHVLISIRDTGVGMDEETLSRIFEPFFTTKEINRGTGLGLATVYGIVKQNRGFINVKSDPEHGSSFLIYWPVTDEKPAPEYVNKIAEDALFGKEQILFVEDDDGVRNFACNAIKRFGYSIIEAINGKNALELMKAEKPEIDILVTDLIMPEMNGEELANKLKTTVPISKVLFLSGYPFEHLVEEGKIKDGINFMQKPYTVQKLLKKIRDILDQK